MFMVNNIYSQTSKSYLQVPRALREVVKCAVYSDLEQQLKGQFFLKNYEFPNQFYHLLSPKPPFLAYRGSFILIL